MENFKLELTHQNGKKSELSPISFTYTIEDCSQTRYNLRYLAHMPKIYCFKADISNFYKTFIKSTWPKFYHIDSIICNFNENGEIYNIFKLLHENNNMIPCRQNIVSEGKIQIETIDELENFPVISDFHLHCCVPVSVDFDNNTIEISVDYVELINTPKSKYQK